MNFLRKAGEMEFQVRMCGRAYARTHARKLGIVPLSCNAHQVRSLMAFMGFFPEAAGLNPRGLLVKNPVHGDERSRSG